MAAPLQVSFRLQGEAQVRRALQQLATQAPQATAVALYMAGVEVWAEAKTRAPLEYGALRNSAFVTPPTSFEPVITVGFGMRYATYQHEGNFNHPRGGERHYLKNALGVVSLQKIADYARSLVERGAKVNSVPALAPARPLIVERARARATGRRAVARLKNRRK